MDNTVFVVLRRKSFAIRQGFPGLTTKTRRIAKDSSRLRVFVVRFFWLRRGCTVKFVPSKTAALSGVNWFPSLRKRRVKLTTRDGFSTPHESSRGLPPARLRRARDGEAAHGRCPCPPPPAPV